MPRKKKSDTEIVPATRAVFLEQRGPDLQVLLATMVRERVDEIVAARGDELGVADFQPRDISYEIQRRQTVFERQKWRLYFEKWGCQTCGKKKVAHASGGRCSNCVMRIAHRLAVIKREYERNNPEAEIDRQIDRLTSRFRSAEALLGDGKK